MQAAFAATGALWAEVVAGHALVRTALDPVVLLPDRSYLASAWALYAALAGVSIVAFPATRNAQGPRAVPGVCWLSVAFFLGALTERASIAGTVWSRWWLPLALGFAASAYVVTALLGRLLTHCGGPSRLGLVWESFAGGALAYLLAWFPIATLDALRAGGVTDLWDGLLGAAGVALVLWLRSRRSRGMLWSGLGAALVVIPLGMADLSGQGLGSSSTAAGHGRGTAPTSHPSVILIVLDTVRADHLGLYGYSRDTSPELDRLAQQADVYERCVSPSSWTVPAHVSLLSGLYPRTHGVHLHPGLASDGLSVPPELHLLPEALSERGYATFGIAANPWLSPRRGWAQGFDRYFAPQRSRSKIPALPAVLAMHLYGMPGLGSRLEAYLAALTRYLDPHLRFHEAARTALDWIEAAPRQPFFLFVNAMEAHDEYRPPPPFDRIWAERPVGRLPFHELVQSTARGERALTEDLLDRLTRLYDGEIRFLDAELGWFFRQLEARDLLDPTLVIITSDHGEHLGERGLLWHRTSLYDPLVRVPLIVKRPWQRRGRRLRHTVQLVDVMPWLLRQLDEGIGGAVAIRPVGRSADAFSELYHDEWIAERLGERFARDLQALEDEGYKVIRDSEGDLELLRIEDGLEKALGANREDTAPRLKGLLRSFDAFLEGVPLAGARRGAASDSDERLRERLRALGYIR